MLVSCLAFCSDLKMTVKCFSEISLDFLWTTWLVLYPRRFFLAKNTRVRICVFSNVWNEAFGLMDGAAMVSDNSAVFLPILFDENNEQTLCEGYADDDYVQGLYTYSQIATFVYITVMKLCRL